MTLVVANVSKLGAVMAADSHVTEEDATSNIAEKIWTHDGLLFAFSGDMAVRDRLQKALTEGLSAAPLPATCEAEMAASQLCSLTKPALQAAYDNFVSAPGENPKDLLGGSLVIIGRTQDHYWLLEIDRHNSATHYTDDGFHTIGSGSLAAHVGRQMLDHYRLPGQETRHLRLLALRTVTTCVHVLGGAYGLGGPVQLWQSTEHGFEKVEGEAFAAVEEGLAQWIQIEQDSLQKLFPDPDEAAAPPLPQTLADDADGG